MDLLGRLQQWYRKQCNGRWEHQCGIAIETLDNAGWRVTIDLAGTPHEHQPFTPLRMDEADDALTWLDCRVDAGRFCGLGGTPMLGAILDVFLQWAESTQPNA